MSTLHLPTVVIASVDVSPDADPALAARITDAAASYAESVGARLVVLTACPPPPLPNFGPLDPQSIALETFNELVKTQLRHANELLLKLAERGRERGLDVHTNAITEPGRLPDLIHEAALDAQKNHGGRALLILAARGRGGLSRRLLGSVAERTAHIATMPVLLLPPEETGGG